MSRWSDSPQFITEFEGSTQTVYARADQYETAEGFIVAAQKCADDYDDGLMVARPRKTMLRINVADPELQDEFGCRFLVMELGENAPRKPGRWMSWAADVSPCEDCEGFPDGSCQSHCRDFCGHELSYHKTGSIEGDPLWHCDKCHYSWNFDPRSEEVGTVEKPATVDWEAEGRNMYGCLPCPKCKSEYRASYSREPTGYQIECDDCGLIEPAVLVDD